MLFAQVGILDTLLLKLAEQGIAGIFCAIFLVVIFFLGRALLRTKDAELVRHEKAAKALAESNAANKNLVIEMKDWTSGMLVETTRIQEGVKNALENQKQEMTELKSEVGKVSELRPAVNSLEQEQAKLVTAINQRRT